MRGKVGPMQLSATQAQYFITQKNSLHLALAAVQFAASCELEIKNLSAGECL